MKAVPLRGVIRWRRWLAMATLCALLGPMAVTVTGCFTLVALLATSNNEKDPRIIPAGDAIYLEPGQVLRLHLRDGSRLLGRFGGRTLLAPEAYRPRFEAHSARGGWAPFALGESLRVELEDGRTIEAPFAGYAMRTLVLRTDSDTLGMRVPFQSARSVRHLDGGLVSLDSLLAADVRGTLPSAEAVALVEGDMSGISWRPQHGFHQVPLEDVQRVTIGKGGGNPAGLILAGVALDVIIVLLIRDASHKSQSPSCETTTPPNWFGDVRWIERPFDRVTGRFVDQNLAGLDSLLTPQEIGQGQAGTH